MMNNPDTSGVTLNAADATNPAATLGWLRDWLAADHDTLAASMRRHSFGIFRLPNVDTDLRRYAWMLGADE